jgi:hypothetical protein
MMLAAMVVVELFTSQGCSSCPPADALLAKLREDTGVIALSEHVDYWDYMGWRDPFSSPVFSERQAAYARRFGLRGPYTPQMVVDGAEEFVGSDAGQARRAIARAAKGPKLAITVRRDGGRVRVEAPAKGELWVATVQAEGGAEVARGENAGRRLRHVSIVRTLARVNGFTHEMAAPGPGLRVVAFLQEKGAGRILGVAAEVQ